MGAYIPSNLKKDDSYLVNRDGLRIVEQETFFYKDYKDEEKTRDRTPTGFEVVLGHTLNTVDPGMENFRYAVIRKSSVDVNIKPIRRPGMGWWMEEADFEIIKQGKNEVSLKIQIDYGNGSYEPQPWIEASWSDGMYKYEFFSRNVPKEEVLKIIESIK